MLHPLNYGRLIVLALLSALIISASPAHGSDGPVIIVVSPQDGAKITAPFDVDVRFVPSPDAVVNPSSVKVEVGKIFGDVDVTEKVRPYLSTEGIHIGEADFPKGHHTLKLSVADDKGRENSKTMIIDVR